jgi:hypothetical protein
VELVLDATVETERLWAQLAVIYLTTAVKKGMKTIYKNSQSVILHF